MMTQKTKKKKKKVKKKSYARMPMWDYTDEPCHLMYSSFSSPFISKIFVLKNT